MPPDGILACRLPDEELVSWRAAGVLAGLGGQCSGGDDVRLVAPDRMLIEVRRAEISALDRDLARGRHGFRLRDAGAAVAGAPALLPADVIDQDVLAQPVWRDEERPALVDARHLVDELGQVGPPLEHERVYDDPVSRAALDLAQRLLDRLVGRRIGERRPAVFFEVGRWLTVRDHDHLPVAAVL